MVALAVLGTILLASAGSSAVTPRRAAVTGQAANARDRVKVKPAGQDGLGIAAGKIKHVWLIILENKSYDATFTGLNHNTYLWQTLPAQGVLLKNYYGTGHFSQDNYISLASGQATESDTQSDCPYYDHFAGHVDHTGSLRTNRNYGQMTSAAGPNAAPGANGCVYPKSVPTLFNQLDQAHVSWKGYAQDLWKPRSPAALRTAPGCSTAAPPSPSPGRPAPRRRPTRGAPTPPTSTCPSTSRSCGLSRSSARATAMQADRQRVQQARRPVPRPQARVDDAGVQLDHSRQLQRRPRRRVPRQQLSGGFANPTTPRAPVNYTGGLYAADLFLAHVIPEIEASQAFKDGGLIDITFDEAFPPFTYTGNSFANSDEVPPNARTSIQDDSAAETLFGRQVALRADWAQHAAGYGQARQPAVSGPRVQLLRRPPEYLRRPDAHPSNRREPACSAAATTFPARAPTPAPPLPRGAPRSMTTRRLPPIPDDRHRQRHSGRGARGAGHRHAGDRHDPQPGRRLRGQGFVPARRCLRSPDHDAGPVSGVTLGAESPRPTRCTTPRIRPPAAATPAAC